MEIKYPAPVNGPHDPKDESTDNAITYFARYTNRTAISDSRIESYDDQSIRFRYKDYDGPFYTWKSMDLDADEFIRRFMMHILPSGFTRIWSAGFLAVCVRKKNLELIHSLLGREYQESQVKAMKATELIQHFYHRDVTVCEKCHGALYIPSHEQDQRCVIDPCCLTNRQQEDIHVDSLREVYSAWAKTVLWP